jgi:hypothetical protein
VRGGTPARLAREVARRQSLDQVDRREFEAHPVQPADREKKC